MKRKMQCVQNCGRLATVPLGPKGSQSLCQVCWATAQWGAKWGKHIQHKENGIEIDTMNCEQCQDNTNATH